MEVSNRRPATTRNAWPGLAYTVNQSPLPCFAQCMKPDESIGVSTKRPPWSALLTDPEQS